MPSEGRKPVGTTLNRDAYQGLIDEDLEWLMKQPRTFEREHIIDIVRLSPDREYGPAPPAVPADDEMIRMLALRKELDPDAPDAVVCPMCQRGDPCAANDAIVAASPLEKIWPLVKELDPDAPTTPPAIEDSPAVPAQQCESRICVTCKHEERFSARGDGICKTIRIPARSPDEFDLVCGCRCVFPAVPAAPECNHQTVYPKQEGLGVRYHCCACQIPFKLVPAAPEVPPIVTVSEMLRSAAPEAGVEEAELVETLAALAHEQWSGWMRYQFEKCILIETPEALSGRWVERWTRQMMTPYADLPDSEKESDRVEARKIIAAAAAARLRGEGEVNHD